MHDQRGRVLDSRESGRGTGGTGGTGRVARWIRQVFVGPNWYWYTMIGIVGVVQSGLNTGEPSGRGKIMAM